MQSQVETGEKGAGQVFQEIMPLTLCRYGKTHESTHQTFLYAYLSLPEALTFLQHHLILWVRCLVHEFLFGMPVFCSCTPSHWVIGGHRGQGFSNNFSLHRRTSPNSYRSGDALLKIMKRLCPHNVGLMTNARIKWGGIRVIFLHSCTSVYKTLTTQPQTFSSWTLP